MDSSHVWFAAKLTFILFCLVGSALTLLWAAGVAISAHVESRQERATRRRNNYRVGSVIR